MKIKLTQQAAKQPNRTFGKPYEVIQLMIGDKDDRVIFVNDANDFDCVSLYMAKYVPEEDKEKEEKKEEIQDIEIKKVRKK